MISKFRLNKMCWKQKTSARVIQNMNDLYMAIPASIICEHKEVDKRKRDKCWIYAAFEIEAEHMVGPGNVRDQVQLQQILER
jgi:hypothetical protein